MSLRRREKVTKLSLAKKKGPNY
jgi:hypothetical protein